MAKGRESAGAAGRRGLPAALLALTLVASLSVSVGPGRVLAGGPIAIACVLRESVRRARATAARARGWRGVASGVGRRASLVMRPGATWRDVCAGVASVVRRASVRGGSLGLPPPMWA